MDFETAARALTGIPYTSAAKGKLFYDLVISRRPRHVLELGFAHGVSTCYFAAAARAIGNCDITAVDLESSRTVEPNLEALAGRLALTDLVHIHRKKSSYTWFLKEEIARQSAASGVCIPKYDLIFIDGPKDWTNDGCAFFLADKLLQPGGILLFDDYNWSYRQDERERGKRHARGYIFPDMSEPEFAEPHVKAIFELLVMQHPAYGEFEILDDQLAMARKSPTGVGDKVLKIHTRYSLRYRLLSAARKVAGRLVR